MRCETSHASTESTPLMTNTCKDKREKTQYQPQPPRTWNTEAGTVGRQTLTELQEMQMRDPKENSSTGSPTRKELDSSYSEGSDLASGNAGGFNSFLQFRRQNRENNEEENKSPMGMNLGCHFCQPVTDFFGTMEPRWFGSDGGSTVRFGDSDDGSSYHDELGNEYDSLLLPQEDRNDTDNESSNLDRGNFARGSVSHDPATWYPCPCFSKPEGAKSYCNEKDELESNVERPMVYSEIIVDTNQKNDNSTSQDEKGTLLPCPAENQEIAKRKKSFWSNKKKTTKDKRNVIESGNTTQSERSEASLSSENGENGEGDLLKETKQSRVELDGEREKGAFPKMSHAQAQTKSNKHDSTEESPSSAGYSSSSSPQSQKIFTHVVVTGDAVETLREQGSDYNGRGCPVPPRNLLKQLSEAATETEIQNDCTEKQQKEKKGATVMKMSRKTSDSYERVLSQYSSFLQPETPKPISPLTPESPASDAVSGMRSKWQRGEKGSKYRKTSRFVLGSVLKKRRGLVGGRGIGGLFFKRPHQQRDKTVTSRASRDSATAETQQSSNRYQEDGGEWWEEELKKIKTLQLIQERERAKGGPSLLQFHPSDASLLATPIPSNHGSSYTLQKLKGHKDGTKKSQKTAPKVERNEEQKVFTGQGQTLGQDQHFKKDLHQEQRSKKNEQQQSDALLSSKDDRKKEEAFFPTDPWSFEKEDNRGCADSESHNENSTSPLLGPSAEGSASRRQLEKGGKTFGVMRRWSFEDITKSKDLAEDSQSFSFVTKKLTSVTVSPSVTTMSSSSYASSPSTSFSMDYSSSGYRTSSSLYYSSSTSSTMYTYQTSDAETDEEDNTSYSSYEGHHGSNAGIITYRVPQRRITKVHRTRQEGKDETQSAAADLYSRDWMQSRKKEREMYMWKL